MLSVGGLFTAVGLGLIAFWNGRAAEVPDTAGPILAVVAFGFAGMGSLALVLGLRNALAPGTVRHVPDDALPDVPTRPLLSANGDAHAWVTHRIHERRLAPDPRVLAGHQKFLFGFAVAFGAFVMWLLWTLRPLGESATPNVVLGAFGMVALGTAVLLIDHVMRAAAKQLTTFEFGGDHWRIHRGDEELASGSQDDLVALQLIGARHTVRSKNRTTITNVLELNLAWRAPGGEIDRHNLMRTSGSFAKLTATGFRLAEELRLPLLYHPQN